MRKDYLQQLLQITQEQREELAKEHYEQFIELLSKRQEILNEIEGLQLQRKLTDEERELVICIKIIDDKNKEEYNRQLEEVREQLKKMNCNKSANMKYLEPYQSFVQGINFDRK